MLPLLEAVPNLSEGRDAVLVRDLAASLASEPGVRLLDVSSDPDHHRAVLTAIGEPEPLCSGLFSLIQTAVDRIDLRRHAGAHPRVGAVDVVPFVPLGETPMSVAIEAAERLGRRVGDQLGIPVFLYGEATPTHRVPADLRRRGLPALTAALAAGELRPDFGPALVHPAAGVILIGARTFLVAFNVWLRSADLAVARAVARTVRERDGGLPGVQALGLYLESRGQTQVSVNLLRPAETSLLTVFEAIRREAAARHVEVDHSEIVGLIPEAVALESAAAALHLPALPPNQILEWHLPRSVKED